MHFKTRIFPNLDLGIKWVLRYKATELESLRCIVSHLEKSCSSKPDICIIFIGDTVFQGTFEHIYDICPIKMFSGGRRVIGNIYNHCQFYH